MVRSNIRIQGNKIWANHEKRVLEIFTLALIMLRDKPTLPLEENNLNRELYFCVNHVNGLLHRENRGIESLPTYDSKNQPDPDDETQSKREDKRPDFQWGMYRYPAIR